MLHPEAGGAEVHLHEIMKGLVSRGHSVTLLCSSFPQAAPVEEIDGIKTLRFGEWYNANFVLSYKYMTALRGGEYDLIVEDINKLPFFFRRHGVSGDERAVRPIRLVLRVLHSIRVSPGALYSDFREHQG
jgi:hypothetical protein